MMPNVTDLYVGRTPDPRMDFEATERTGRTPRDSRSTSVAGRVVAMAGRLISIVL